MRLIDADKLENELCGRKTYLSYEEVHEVIDLMDELPTINAIPVPDNATNGDMIKAMFPHFLREDETEYFHRLMNSNNTEFVKTGKSWWNAPYKESEEV